ncbi:Glycosyltransferase involved in cell wall bisynthesis [Marinitoga hydrogenitolerans DSM 16785]|uniref:Glycosyltransferase involved in cell wall bisynthesis n=1 Tax=Marinitoga hydrogenitolerans (strain DSM 16785 / JCM 12826 / AT1271) TaxID=1122195 RepID=A0A1M4U4J8_MARH1|nr:glycosyltransferase family 2 protein [Marinitoga hydrogenitolerans]SHE51741.1 Glycosyltransferase involved in cell wall bisynthesis [Marinitoga hydrogenitolerans DSM 16785]
MNQKLISACIMAKNEEQNIERCLNSIKDFCDEIIFVDTGSTDNTVEIAKKYTNKIYFFPWNGNFSDARNETLKYATSEWVFIVDADEEASENLRNNIRSFLKSLEKDIVAVYIPTVNYLDFDKKHSEIASTARFFKNGKVKYENIVHNQPVYKGKTIKVDLELLHYGYIWTRLRRKQKTERTLALIEKYLEENPEDEYYLIQYMKTLSIAQKHIEKMKVGYKIAQKVLKSARKKDYKPIPMTVEFIFLWGIELMNKGYWDEAEKWFKLGSRWNLDAFYGLMNVYYNKRDWENLKLAAYDFLKYLNIFENRRSEITWSMQSLFKKNEGLAYLAMAKIKTKDFENLKNIINDFDYTKNNEKIIALYNLAFDEFTKEKDYDIKEKLITFLKNLHSNIVDKINYFDNNTNIKKYDLIFQKSEGRNPYLFLEYFVNRLKDEKNIVGFLLTFIDNLFEDDFEQLLELLLKIRRIRKDISTDKEKAVIELLIGDILTKNGRFNEAKTRYKKAVNLEKSLAKFVQVLIEDILTQMNPKELIPAYVELKEEMSKKTELFFDINIFDHREISLFDYYFGETFPELKYVYCIKMKNDNKKLYESQLKKVYNTTKNNYFKAFVSLRLYNYFKENNKFDEAKKYLKYALELNPILADLSNGHYLYTGFYFEENIKEKEDKIVNVLNIGEIISLMPIVNPIKTWYESEKTGLNYVSPIPTYSSMKSFDNYLKNYSKYFNSIYPDPLKNKKLNYILSEYQIDNLLEINSITPFFKKEHISISNLEYIEDRKYNKQFDLIVFFNPEYSRKLIDDINYLRALTNHLLVIFNLNENIFLKDPRAFWYLDAKRINKFFNYLAPSSFEFINDKFLLVKYENLK